MRSRKPSPTSRSWRNRSVRWPIRFWATSLWRCTERARPIACHVALDSPHDTRLSVADDELLLTGRNGSSHGVAGALIFAARVKVLPHGGRLYRGVDGLRVEG